MIHQLREWFYGPCSPCCECGKRIYYNNGYDWDENWTWKIGGNKTDGEYERICLRCYQGKK